MDQSTAPDRLPDPCHRTWEAITSEERELVKAHRERKEKRQEASLRAGLGKAIATDRARADAIGGAAIGAYDDMAGVVQEKQPSLYQRETEQNYRSAETHLDLAREAMMYPRNLATGEDRNWKPRARAHLAAALELLR